MQFVLLLAAIFGLDYKIKSYIETHKKEGQSESICGGYILIRRMSNTGAACSLLDENPEVVKWGSSLVLFVTVLCFIKELFKKGNRAMKFCYSLILGGGLSNFYDRIKKGAVTDYFSFCVPVKSLQRLVFNISDMFIMIGTVLTIIVNIRKTK